ncbi:hypothetical protein AAHA92_10152 [Salvia divinorum]|uniref:Uncharacterized protein n=1 Tax=Salvia divinorum TaxID=28513 RepID=A0ABD1HUE9_SALDI
MSKGSRFGRWNNAQNWRDTEYNWRIREVATPVTTRSGLSTAVPSLKEEYMANMENDPEIGSLNAHLSGEPAQAIVMTPGQAGIEVKNNVLAVMPHFYGRKIDNPYEFLHEFCKLCGI